jgi:KaiC/GvpD/RAD55 family RecA-like ATPase
MFYIHYKDQRHEPREWRAAYETKAEAMRQAAFDVGEYDVEVQDEEGRQLVGKGELRKHAKECGDLPAFADRAAINRKV